MNLPLTIFALALFQSATLSAAELKPFLKNDKLGVILKDLKFPDSISKDLVSGLTTKILVRLELLTDSSARSQKMADINIKYDLWNEKFKIDLHTIDGGHTSMTMTDLKAVLSFLSNLKIANIWPAAELPGGSMSVKADTLLNPVEKEQMQKIRKWVAQNSVAAPAGPSGLGKSTPSVPSPSNALFIKIFEQYARGANVAAVWRETISSKPFILSEVPQ